jgi:glycosyltransferase involved in cell wall biosynthesis
MARRKLLLVTYHFPPSAAVAVYRMLGCARHLPTYGWDVCVVAPPRMPHEPVDEALLQQIPAETHVYRTPYPEHWWARQGRRFVSNGVWVPRALAACAEAVARERPDVVMTSSPPHSVHWLGLLLQRRHRLPWLADFRDPWVTNNAGVRRLSAVWQARIWGERLVVARADRIVMNTPLARDGLQRAFPRHRQKIAAVTNGYDPERFGAPADVPPPRGQLTLLHAGELYSGRDPRPLLDALAELARDRPADAPSFRLKLLGQSTENRFDLQEAIAQRGLADHVELGGQVPYAAALDAMKRADVLLVLDTPGRRVSIPAKLYEYLGAQRPILALAEPDSDTAWALRESGVVHRVAPPRDVARIRTALEELRAGLCDGAFAAAHDGRPAVFTREAMARALADNLDRCLGRRAGAGSEQTPLRTLEDDCGTQPQHGPDAGRPCYARA